MKKTYIKPALKTKSIVEAGYMLAASAETLPVVKDETVDEALSKQTNDIWENDRPFVWDD